jgi:hypothetical protein
MAFSQRLQGITGAPRRRRHSELEQISFLVFFVASSPWIVVQGRLRAER